MWARNVLFLGLLGAGLVAFVGSLVPSRQLARSPRFDAAHQDGFDAAVARVDESLAKDWSEQQILPADPAPDLQVARRLSLALTGSIPSLEEIRAFEALPADSRLDWWANRLLDDPRFNDYFAERLARAFVGNNDGPFLVYRRRRFVTWLSGQLAENRPYDQLVSELIASDGLWTTQPAINFVTANQKEGIGIDEAALAARVARAFLGIRLDCAECHDHPFEPWKQQQFHALAAYFGRTEQTLTGIREGNDKYETEDRQTGEKRVISPQVPYQPELVPQDRGVRGQLAAWVTHRENKAFARAAANRMWALLFGRPLLEPVDNIRLDREVPELLDLLATDFAEHGYNLRRLVQLIASTQAFRLDSQAPLGADGKVLPGREITPLHEEHWAVFPLTRLRPEQVVGGLLQSSLLATIDHESHIVVKLARAAGEKEFVKRYGDAGEEELEPRGGTIPQRLLLMNGELVRDRTKHDNPFYAANRIAMLAPDDAKAIETAYLSVLTRRPAADEAEHFAGRLRDTKGNRRRQALEDLFWDLLNSTEFSWNH
jgi:hypothetical protein